MRQGFTLSLGGPDGGGPWPFCTYLDSADHAGLGMNVAYLAGHNTIRKQVMGTENRAPTAAELSRMKGMVAQAMREEGVGLLDGVAEALGRQRDSDYATAAACAMVVLPISRSSTRQKCATLAPSTTRTTTRKAFRGCW